MITEYGRATLLALSLELGSKHAFALNLLRSFEAPEDIWMESPFSLAFKTGATLKNSAFVQRKEQLLARAEKEFALATAKRVSIITIKDSLYPALLKHLYDPPLVLYALGDISLLNSRSVAMVGTRRPTIAGKFEAFRIAQLLASKGITVVSGAALGIDASAHYGALEVDGGTIAVLGNGVGYLYPRENYRLYQQLAEKGLLLSEFPIGARPQKFYFPMRNRLIAGLSQKLLVVQAPRRSGALITAQFALEQGKDVYACPWQSTVEAGQGGLSLLADGAGVVVSGEEILGTTADGSDYYLSDAVPDFLSEDEKMLLALLSFERKSLQELTRSLVLPVSKVLALLMKLVLKRLAVGWNGNFYTRAI